MAPTGAEMAELTGKCPNIKSEPKLNSPRTPMARRAPKIAALTDMYGAWLDPNPAALTFRVCVRVCENAHLRWRGAEILPKA